jgi:hypothetical protein
MELSAMDFLDSKYNYSTRDNKEVVSNKIIDWDLISEMCYNEKSMCEILIKGFLYEYDKSIDIIKKTNDNIIIHDAIHSIKGTASTIGLNLFSCCSNYYMNLLLNVSLNTMPSTIISTIDDNIKTEIINNFEIIIKRTQNEYNSNINNFF